MSIRNIAAIVIASGLASLACGPDTESIRATQTAFMAARNYSMSTPVSPPRAEVEATVDAQQAKIAECDPKVYLCDAVRFNNARDKIRTYVPEHNALMNRVDELYNRRFEEPRGAIILAKSEEDFRQKADVIRSEQDSEGQRVFKWMHEVIATCHQVKRQQEKMDSMRADLSGIYIRNKEKLESARDKIAEMEARTQRAVRTCTPGNSPSFDNRFQELAGVHRILNPPSNW